MAKRKNVQPVTETVDDAFNELGIRNRTPVEEEILCHDLREERGDDGVVFYAEVRVNLYLEDGRMLSKVVDVEFDADDVE